jgi:hypothetical protein
MRKNEKAFAEMLKAQRAIKKRSDEALLHPWMD